MKNIFGNTIVYRNINTSRQRNYDFLHHLVRMPPPSGIGRNIKNIKYSLDIEWDMPIVLHKDQISP